MSEKPDFHQLTQQAERDLKDAANMLDELIDKQGKPRNPQSVGRWTLESLRAIGNALLAVARLRSMAGASHDVTMSIMQSTTAAMQWEADRAEVQR